MASWYDRGEVESDGDVMTAKAKLYEAYMGALRDIGPVERIEMCEATFAEVYFNIFKKKITRERIRGGPVGNARIFGKPITIDDEIPIDEFGFCFRDPMLLINQLKEGII